MTLTRRLFFALIGLLLLFSWSFRLRVIFFHRFSDPYLVGHLLVAFFSLSAGGYLLGLSLRRTGLGRRQAPLLILFAFGMGMHWIWRIFRIWADPASDPNPRAHLYLAGLLLLVSGYLARIGWRTRRGPA